MIAPEVNSEALPPLQIALEKFRKEYDEEDHLNAINRIKEALLSNKVSDAAVVRFLVSGIDDLKSDLSSLWQTIGVVAAFIGAISVTIVLTSPARGETFAVVDDFPSSTISYRLSQAYYAAWIATSFCEIAAVMIVTISSVHFNLMVKEDEMVWFVLTWEPYTNLLPQIFLVIGCFTFLIGCVLGAFLIGNMITGYVAIGLAGAVVITVVSVWLTMLHYNKQKEKDAIAKIRKQFLLKVEEVNQKYKSEV